MSGDDVVGAQISSVVGGEKGMTATASVRAAVKSALMAITTIAVHGAYTVAIHREHLVSTPDYKKQYVIMLIAQ